MKKSDATAKIPETLLGLPVRIVEGLRGDGVIILAPLAERVPIVIQLQEDGSFVAHVPKWVFDRFLADSVAHFPADLKLTDKDE